jgi:S-adenosylmethionine-diacylglycerol 3-amino-3-carboxypropyl transferase
MTVFSESPIVLALAGNIVGLSEYHSVILGFSSLSVAMLLICILRMWAGSILSSQTVMSFKVQSDRLQIVGPYKLIRNPIYLADLLAITCFSLCMPLVALLMPVLFYFHYIQLIHYEERSFQEGFSRELENYKKQTPRLFPTPKSLSHFFNATDTIQLNYDGLRHNALYLLFIPGFLVAAAEQSFVYAVLIGAPGVIDWAIVHTKIGIDKTNKAKEKSDRGEPKKSKVFEDILYAQCWEDPSVDRAAFNIREDDILFSITSGGCNVLTFLLDNPKKIIALDISPYQNYMLELKMACFKGFDHQNLLKFSGITPCIDRVKMYHWIRGYLSVEARRYWDQNQSKIKQGIIHSGRYEKYMRLLGRLLNLLIGKNVISDLFRTYNRLERIKLYDQKWKTLRWGIFTRIMLSRKTMSLLFDKAFFAYLEDSFSFGDHFARKTERAFKELPLKENYFLTYILFGNYDTDALPAYLRRENFDTIRSRVSRIEIITGSCQDYFYSLSEDSISKFNYSNIFEWMSEREFELLLRETIRVAKDGAILTYRNLLVQRERPYLLNSSIRSLPKLARNLKSVDLSFIYNNYVIEKIKKERPSWTMKSKSFQIAKN